MSVMILNIAGHRRSGTNFAQTLLGMNFFAKVKPTDKHKLPENFKGSFPVIYVYRFPFDVFSSLYDWGNRHWFTEVRPTFSEFLRYGPIVGDGVRPKEGAVEYWKRH